MGRAGLILDTHVLLWLVEGNARLEGARSRIDKAWADDGLGVSAITFWEIAMLAEAGRVALAQPVDRLRTRLLEAGLREIAVDGDVGIRAVRLEEFHGDPADRMIVATAVITGAPLVTADARILAWDGPLRRVDARGR